VIRVAVGVILVAGSMLDETEPEQRQRFNQLGRYFLYIFDKLYQTIEIRLLLLLLYVYNLKRILY
jgi:hypothetical protein